MLTKEKIHALLILPLVGVLFGALVCSRLAEAAAPRSTETMASSSEKAGGKPADSANGCQASPVEVDATKRRTSYILGDSISYGLKLDGLEARLQETLGGSSRISFDSGRSITAPGHQINKSALESIDVDRAFISSASVIVIVLGTNQLETSFVQSQQQLLQRLKAVAPQATYYWVDIGSTMSNQVDGWNARNKTIYDNAKPLGYTVISRYKAIFGPAADPLQIKPGQNFPNLPTERGYGGVGNIHGAYAELSAAILAAVSNAAVVVKGCASGA